MPIYSYICPACKEKDEIVRTMSERNNVVLCPNCAFVMNRDFRAEHNVISRTCSSVFWSNTLGVHPEQVAGERLRHPNWKIHDDGRVLVEGLADQRKKVKELGMTNFDDNV